MLGVGVTLWGLPLAVVGAVPREGVILMMLALVGFGNALVDVGIFTLPPRLVPDAVLARLFGALESLGALVVAGAGLLTPVLLDAVGIRWTLIVVGALGPLYVAVAWTRLRSIDSTVTRRDLEIALLDALPMFRPLAMPAIEQLADRLEVQTVNAGEQVVTQGDYGDRFYIIEHGTARVVRDGAVIRDLVDGDCFGEIALLRDVPRTASVVAMATSPNGSTSMREPETALRHPVPTIRSRPAPEHVAGAVRVDAAARTAGRCEVLGDAIEGILTSTPK